MNRRFRERIESASARVWIQTPYFLPPRRLLRALCSSAKKGVDVRILVPSKNDYRFIRWMSHQVMEILVRNGVKIFEHTTVFTHKKILLVDDAVFLGSVNFNHRSFLHDLEVEITVTHSSSKALIENSFRQAEKDSQPLTLRRLAAIPNRLKILGRILLFFKYWC
jgi:phosphatidylserine/phosphatidylglycerophosphate/cardiolipin synthase-like enzyme